MSSRSPTKSRMGMPESGRELGQRQPAELLHALALGEREALPSGIAVSLLQVMPMSFLRAAAVSHF